MYVIAYDFGTTGVKTCLLVSENRLKWWQASMEYMDCIFLKMAEPNRILKNGGGDVHYNTKTF